MKWLIKFFLLISILTTAGSSHQSFANIKSNFSTLASKPNVLNKAILTPLSPEKDSGGFQIIEDEEEDISSRVKKSLLYSSTLLACFCVGALLSLYQSTKKHRPNNRLLSFNSLPRYIQLRTIRV